MAGVYNKEGKRDLKETEADNRIYDISYSEGRFYRVNSPQPVDW